MFVEQFKAIKCKFKSIQQTHVDYTKLYSCIHRVNQLTFNGYHLLRYYLLSKFDKMESFPQINEDLIEKIFTVLAGHKIVDTQNTNLNSELKTYCDEFLKITHSCYVDPTNLSYMLNVEASKIITSYKNNIILNFHKYLFQWVNELHNVPRVKRLSKDNYKKLTKDEQLKFKLENVNINKKRKEMLKNLSSVKTDLLMSTLKSSPEYHNFIESVREILPPLQENTLMEDVQKFPLKYLKILLTMNRQLEDSKLKIFQALPLRTDLCLKYVSIDTSAIKDIFGEIAREKLLKDSKKIADAQEHINHLKATNKNIQEINNLQKQLNALKKSTCTQHVQPPTNQNKMKAKLGLIPEVSILTNREIWEKYFNINLHKFKIKRHVFNELIQTDGTSVSIIFAEKDTYRRKKVASEKKTAASAKSRREMKTLTPEEVVKRNNDKCLMEAQREKIRKEQKKQYVDEFKKLPKEEQEQIKLRHRLKCNEFNYITDILKDTATSIHLKQQLYRKKICVADPGGKSPLTILGFNGRYNYRNRRRIKEIKRKKYARLRQNKLNELCANKGVQYAVNELTKMTSKTTYSKAFMSYTKRKYNLIKRIGTYKMKE